MYISEKLVDQGKDMKRYCVNKITIEKIANDSLCLQLDK
jgi:hypothetical protein